MEALRPKSLVSLHIGLASVGVGFLLTACSGGGTASYVSSDTGVGIHPDQGCTVLYATDGDVALAGNNEDYTNPYTYVWFVPPEPGKYGRVYFGYEDGFPQGGVNEAGLFFDGAALPYKPMTRPAGGPMYDGAIPPGNLFDKIMSESASVADVLEILGSYSHVGMDTYQLLFGDADGGSVIVDGDTIHHRHGSFQLVTNFRLTWDPDPPYRCERYTTARTYLSEAESFSVELFRDILEATHQEAPGPTLYSNIYDLKNGQIYLYYHHDFENVVVLDVDAELAEGFHFYRLASLFPDNPEAAEYEAGRPTPSEVEIADRITPIGLDQLAGYTGDYLVGSMGDTVSVYIEDGHLYFWQPFSLPIELLPKAPDRFFHVFRDGNELSLSFRRNDQDAISGAGGTLFGESFVLMSPASDPVAPSTTAPPSQSETSSPTTTAASPSETSAPTTVAVAPVDENAEAGIPWWGWLLAVVGGSAIAVAVRLTLHRL